MIRLSRGDLQLTVLDGGSLRLDGGAMCGVVPKPLWERERVPDARNRIGLAMNVLLVQDGRRNLLIDTGAGTAWDDKTRDIYAIEGKTAAELLAPAGLRPEQVDVVLDTHLHFDHAGGNTTPEGLAFPRAQYVVQRRELEFARHTNERTAGSYLAHNFERVPFTLIDGETEVLPGIRAVPTPGHVPYHQSLLVESGGEKACFIADLVPTSAHLPLPWIMGYDLEPLVTLETRRKIYQRAEAEGWLLVFEHDPKVVSGRLGQDGKGFGLVEPQLLG